MRIDTVQLWGLAGAIALLAAAWVLPWPGLEHFFETKTRILPNFRKLARRRGYAVLAVALLAFAGDALVSWWKPPVPTVLDEFSYVLAADTFASGRLSNPTPAEWQRFETPEVLVRPSYQSKYPPGQAVLLGLGQRLTGNPLAGVWLSSALACAALCWMLQAWVGETWALYGALLAACHLAWLGYWAQSYWGGMTAALGGALLYGGVRRIVDSGGTGARIADGVWLGLGVVILASTRPFEGLLGAIPAGIVLTVYLFRSLQGWRLRWRQVALPVVIVVLLGAGAMLAYNQAVTGDMWRLPYQVYEQRYDAVPSFIFQPLRPWPELQNVSMRAAAVGTLSAWRWAHGFYRLAFVTSKLFALWQFAFGVALSLPFLALVWAERWPWAVRGLQVASFAVLQVLAVERLLFWPSPGAGQMVALLLALLVQAVLLVRFFPGRWERCALAAMGLVSLGLAVETWRFHSHYVAPVVPLTLVLVVEAMRRSWKWSIGRRAPGKVLALGLPILTIALAAVASTRPAGPLERWAQQRADMEKHLEELPGRQVVIVHYGPQHDFYEEWVENRADLQRAQVVWAREGSTEENCRLLAAFPGRTVWLLDADQGRLEKYVPNCDGRPGAPSPSVPVLESLPEQ